MKDFLKECYLVEPTAGCLESMRVSLLEVASAL